MEVRPTFWLRIIGNNKHILRCIYQEIQINSSVEAEGAILLKEELRRPITNVIVVFQYPQYPALTIPKLAC